MEFWEYNIIRSLDYKKKRIAEQVKYMGTDFLMGSESDWDYETNNEGPIYPICKQIYLTS